MALALVKTTPSGTFTGSWDTPGPLSVSPGNTIGNLLVLAAAWDLSASTYTNVTIPSSSVGDSSGNLWRLAADSGSSVAGCRTAIWFCPNALAIQQWLSFAVQGYVPSFQYIVMEFSGLPAGYHPSIDFIQPGSNSNATSLNVSGTATVPDYVFGIAGIGAIASSVTITPPAGLTSVATASTGYTDPISGSSPNGIISNACYGTFGAGSVPATWTYSSSGPVAACLIGITQSSHSPAQLNPNFPVVKVEAAFGTTPGDPSKAIAESAWVDLTTRCITTAGVAGITITRGQQYELSQPEAGTMTIRMNNADGALDPLNQSGPYYPDVILGTPVRVTAFWEGRRYAVGFGYVERWPQNWPDMPQWGLSDMVATDAVGVASSTQLPSAVQGEILADNPYICFPFSEQYSTSTTTINGLQKVSADSDGLIAINTSRINQNTATYTDGNLSPVDTGLSMGFLGDSGTGMGASGYQAVDNSGSRGPGATYGPDSGLPVIGANGEDATIELWANVPSFTASASGLTMQLLQVLGAPNIANKAGPDLNYLPGVFLLLLWQIDPNTAIAFVDIFFGNTFSGSSLLTPGQPCHFAFVYTAGELQWFVNGDVISTFTGPYFAELQAIAFSQAGYSYAYETSTASGSGNYNQAVAYGTVYSYAMTPQRIASHYDSGITGFGGDSLIERFGRYLAWGNLGLNPAGPSGPESPVLPQVVQSVVIANSLSGSFASNVTPGNCVVVVVNGFSTGTPSVSGVTLGGSAGNFEQAASAVSSLSGDEYLAAIWVDPDSAGGVANVAVTGAGGLSVNANYGIILLEVSGLVSVSVVDQAATAIGNGTGWGTSGIIGETTVPNEIWIGANSQISTATPPTTPWSSLRYSSTNAGAGYRIVSGIGTPVYAGIQGSSGVWAAVTITLKGVTPSSSYEDELELGPAYSTSGSALSDALNADVLSDNGKWYGNAAGNLVILPRPALYNLPSTITFTDSISGISSGGIPYLPDLGFDYDNSYVSNVVQATLVQGPNTLISPIEKNQASITEYFQRGPLSQQISAASAQDAYDRAYWSLSKYAQPSMRVQQLTANPAANPAFFTALLQTDIATIATVNRSPIGGASYSLPVIVEKVEHSIGPGVWHITYQMSPYVPEDSVLTADTSNDVLGSNTLPW
jgi:hypothetical protein